METHTPTTTTAARLKWNAKTRRRVVRSETWYVVAGILTLALFCLTLFRGDIMFAIVILLTAGAYVLLRNVEDVVHTFECGPEGLTIDGKASNWDAWEKFWILSDGEIAELHIARKGRRADFTILIEGVDPLLVRDTLAQRLPYDAEKYERLIDYVIRSIKL